MVSELDESVGKVVKALQEKKILAHTTIIFLSDNGGQTTGALNNTGELLLIFSKY